VESRIVQDYQNGRKNMKRKELIIVAVVLILIVGLVLYNGNYKITKEKQEYLQYALGDYEIVKTETVRGQDGYGFPYKKKYWTINYKNYLGETKELIIDGLDKDNTASFYESIQFHIYSVITEEFRKIQINATPKFNHTSGSVHLSYINVDKTKSISYNTAKNIKKIKVSELSISKLVSNNLKAHANISIKMDNEISEYELKNELLNVFGKYFEYFDKNHLKITFSWNENGTDELEYFKYLELSYSNGYVWE